MRFKPLLTAFFASLISACSGGSGLSDNRIPTGSHVMATSSHFKALYVTHPQHGTIGRVALGGGAVKSFAVGQRPIRIARSGSKVFVTLAGERKIAVLEEQGEELVEIARIDVGAEPYGVVASDDGARIYATVSLEDRVVEIDGGSLEILRSWSVRGQPRWLALHPSGASLYVASAMGGALTWIDLAGDRMSEIDFHPGESFGDRTAAGVTATFSRRYTGDPAVSPDGQILAVPGILVNNNDPVPDDSPSTEPGDPGAVPPPDEKPGIPGGGGGYDSGRFNPVVVTVTLEDDGEPVVDTVQPVSVVAFAGASINGYPSAVSIDPDSRYAIATIEGAAAAVAINIEPVDTSEPGVFDGLGGGSSFDAAPIAPGFGGGANIRFKANLAYGVPAGPRGVIFADADRPVVFGAFDRQIGELDMVAIRDQLEPVDFDGGDAVPVASAAAPREAFAPPSEFMPLQVDFAFKAVNRVEIVDEVLSPVEARGRALFFAANDSKMSSPGSGVSCATCHFDGRNDGLTWNFVRGLRQTPSLAGKVSLNAPVRWEGDSPTVAHDALRTSQGLMGGQGLTADDAAAIEAFLDTNPEINAPVLATDAAAARGKLIFERADVACASCHNGPRFTDKQKYPMKGLSAVQTRSLIGIAASAPYFHDGSAATLRDLLESARDGSMGNTSSLSDAEMNDLVAYLKSL